MVSTVFVLNSTFKNSFFKKINFDFKAQRIAVRTDREDHIKSSTQQSKQSAETVYGMGEYLPANRPPDGIKIQSM